MNKKIIRKIVKIDEDKCNGCGLCIPGCAEGAIEIVDGKAKLVSDNLCDGLGNCLGKCPQDAITIEEREADEFDEKATIKKAYAEASDCMSPAHEQHADCPGSQLHSFHRSQPSPAKSGPGLSRLQQWPIQLHLLPATGKIWHDADIIIAADCTAFALGSFHDDLLIGKTLGIACPKLDDTQVYIEKLTEIFRENDIHSITIARMSVPCCGGLVDIVKQALELAGKDMPLRVVIIAIDGNSYQTQMM